VPYSGFKSEISFLSLASQIQEDVFGFPGIKLRIKEIGISNY